MDDGLKYWGKARPQSVVPCHPAAYHCLDVAACSYVLLERLPLLRRRLSILIDIDDPLPFLSALIALHDIGKFSRAFQAHVPALWGAELGDIADAPADPGHGGAGLWLWRDRLHHVFLDGLRLMPLARAVFGHHGTPIAEDSPPPQLRALYGRRGLARAEEFAENVVPLICAGQNHIGPHADLVRASFLVAGLVVLADWIGSSQNAFKYEEPRHALADYWRNIALPRATAAVADAGVVPVTSAPLRSYPTLTRVEGFVPTPMQIWAETVPVAPGLYIIEDSTGAGKTEAAVMLAHRLIAGGFAEGAYVALPTMATADGMYARMGETYRALFADDGLPSLALAHGARDLHAGFRSAILDPSSDSHCSEWIADDRRKTFLAQMGVGTIDQAILSILPARYQCLRVLGLAQRVLILDEVHAYDAYMSQEIARLLEFQSSLGGSTILLSATLPAEVKTRLLHPYGPTAAKFSNAYPLATVQTVAMTETAVAPRGETVRRVPLSFVETPDEGLSRAVAAARAGQAVLYIRNTVADAVHTFDALPGDIQGALFHARFALCDRQAIQRDALERFGKHGRPEQREGRLLVATQVVEQSLDLDFDLIVTDLAPVDLIIQRAGRLWRHRRDTRPVSAAREMVIVGPYPTPDADDSWLPSSLRMTSYVYKDHGRMWLTADVLRRVQVLDAPDGLRHLIEHVYGPEPEQRVPSGLVEALLDIRSIYGTERAMAHGNTLRVIDGYARTGPWDRDDRVPTRLGEDTVTIRLAAIREGQVHPWARRRSDETSISRLWSLSELRVRRHYLRSDAVPEGFDAAVATAKSTWTIWQHNDVPMLVVNAGGSTPTNLLYCPRWGLRRTP